MYAYPQTFYQRGNHGTAPMEPTSGNPGMTMRQYYLGCILTGLASNPTTMLNIEDHLEYAKRLADKAGTYGP